MPFDPATFGIVAGTSVLAPIISKGIGSLFGLDQPSEQEREAARTQQQALTELRAAAEGRAASPAQLEAQYARNRAMQALAGMAQQGTAQQRAGNVRMAMQKAPEIMAQQGALASHARAEEMSRAREALAGLSARVAEQQAAAGRAGRQYTQSLIGAGIQGIGAGAVAGLEAGKSEGADRLSQSEIARYNASPERGAWTQPKAVDMARSTQAQTASPSLAAQTALGGSAVAPTSMVAPPAGAPMAVATAPTVAPTLGKQLPSTKLGQKFTSGLYDGEADQGLHRRLASLGY